MSRFGEQRLVRPGDGLASRWLYRVMGVADPAHFLHYLYLRRALRRLGPLRPRRILDAGCGAGDFSFYLASLYPASEVVGIDVDADRIAANRSNAARLDRSNVVFRVCDICDFDDGDFDLVVSIDVLEHIERQDWALAALYRALRPGGKAFLHIPTVRVKPVPFARWLTGFQKWAEEEHLADELTAEQFGRKVEARGLQVETLERTFGFYTGELATSLFAIPYTNTHVNRLVQAMLAPACRMLAYLDTAHLDSPRYGVAVTASRP